MGVCVSIVLLQINGHSMEYMVPECIMLALQRCCCLAWYRNTMDVMVQRLSFLQSRRPPPTVEVC